MNERPTVALSGWAMAAIWLVVVAGTAWLYLVGHVNVPVLVTIVWTLVLALALTGFAMVQPNQSRVVILFGRYLGTVRRIGWIWTWPLTSKRTVSLRVQNFESSVIKVNDAAGNPVEIAAVIVWRVVDTARAVFNVEKYEEFVRAQTETAVRHVASLFPYDSYEAEQRSLRANADEGHDEPAGWRQPSGYSFGTHGGTLQRAADYWPLACFLSRPGNVAVGCESSNRSLGSSGRSTQVDL